MFKEENGLTNAVRQAPRPPDCRGGRCDTGLEADRAPGTVTPAGRCSERGENDNGFLTQLRGELGDFIDNCIFV